MNSMKLSIIIAFALIGVAVSSQSGCSAQVASFNDNKITKSSCNAETDSSGKCCFLQSKATVGEISMDINQCAYIPASLIVNFEEEITKLWDELKLAQGLLVLERPIIDCSQYFMRLSLFAIAVLVLVI